MAEDQLKKLTEYCGNFVRQYYFTFDKKRVDLVGLYTDQSMLHVEKEGYRGKDAIMQKWMTIPEVEHKFSNDGVQVQPSIGNGAIIFVTGGIRIGEDSNFVKFSQVFHLRQHDNGNPWLLSDMFALNYG